MASFKTCMELCRVSNLPTVWTNVLAAALLSGAAPTVLEVLLLAVALSFFYMAGMSLNDVCDLTFDRINRPFRPLPSGRMSALGASALTMGLFTAGLSLLTLAPYTKAIGAAFALVFAIVLYDCHHKRSPYSVLIMAICRYLLFIVVALALSGQISGWVLVIGGIQFCYVILISLVARYETHRRILYSFPAIPAMLAGISLLDGLVLAAAVALPWIFVGIAGSALTWYGQRFVRGD